MLCVCIYVYHCLCHICVGSRLERSWFTIKQDNPPLAEPLMLTAVSTYVCLFVCLSLHILRNKQVVVNFLVIEEIYDNNI